MIEKDRYLEDGREEGIGIGRKELRGEIFDMLDSYLKQHPGVSLEEALELLHKKFPQ